MAQQSDLKENNEKPSYTNEVTQMVSFLQYTLNVLADPGYSAQEKDIIIHESYLKLFRDAKVQIEDDLDKNRDVPTNKDVQAYLKDVDFFFKRAKFEFNILDIRDDVTQEGQQFFIVKLMRNLSGITVDGDSVNMDQERYIEINLDEKNKDLRIASIYTTRLSRDQELAIWWSGLSEPWRTLLGVDIEVKSGLLLSDISAFSDSTYVVDDQEVRDSLRIIDFVKLAAGKEEINLSGSRVITDLKPLDELKQLKKLDISYSAITDLFPIRNLTTLQLLDCSHTRIENLSPLKYSKSLKELDISFTPVASIMVLQNFNQLEVLRLEQTVIDSIPALKDLPYLKVLQCASTNLESLDSLALLHHLVELDISNTAVDDVAPLAGLDSLRILKFDKTKISDLSPLSQLVSLEQLSFENSPARGINSLVGLKKLSEIHADQSGVSFQNFIPFAQSRPDVKVYFMTEELRSYWNGLQVTWKDILKSVISSEDTMTRQDLHEILKIKRLDLERGADISDLSPLQEMPLLEYLNISGTDVTDLGPVGDCRFLRTLLASNTQLSDLSPLQNLDSLRKINFQFTPVRDLAILSSCHRLDTLLCDNTSVEDISFLDDIPGFSYASFDHSAVEDSNISSLKFDEKISVVIYKSERLRSWWGNMDDHWQDYFRKDQQLSQRPSSVELHKIAEKRSLEVKGTDFKNLDILPEMVRLQRLKFYDTRINSLYPLSGLSHLVELQCPRNPIEDIGPLSSLKNLEILDLSNTRISDIKPVRDLGSLRKLTFSGTNVKDISPVQGLINLEELEFSKTRVRQINALAGLQKLQVLKCYNNKISVKRMDEFRNSHPDCEVIFY